MSMDDDPHRITRALNAITAACNRITEGTEPPMPTAGARNTVAELLADARAAAADPDHPLNRSPEAPDGK